MIVKNKKIEKTETSGCFSHKPTSSKAWKPRPNRSRNWRPTVDELSKTGHALRNKIAEAGVELTPSELAEGIADAVARVGHGPCTFCGKTKELRHGGCFECVMGGAS